ncbi:MULTISPECIES: hypothetical protein [unclassified Sphingobium]|uniref:hypothetical protein n=1 Tax=unclassified Sphingobium TaxID=2611147 RepID=UPI0035A647A0
MPIKRRKAKANPHAITPAVVAAYIAGDREALHHALNLRPWTDSPLDAKGDCPWPENTAGAATWPLAVRLRNEIEEELHHAH